MTEVERFKFFSFGVFGGFFVFPGAGKEPKGPTLHFIKSVEDRLCTHFLRQCAPNSGGTRHYHDNPAD